MADTNPPKQAEKQSETSKSTEEKAENKVVEMKPAEPQKAAAKPVSKAPAKKTSTRKTAAKKTSARKAPAKKAPALKTVAKKASVKKAAPKKAARTSSRSAKSKTTTSPRTAKATSNKTMEAAMAQGKTQFDKLTKEATAASQEVTESLVKSSNVLAKGYEELFKTCFSLYQSSAEKNASAVKSLLSCKTLNELTEAQNKIAQENFDDFMTGATKISELSVKVHTEAFEPLNDQISKTVKKASETIAA